MAMSVSEYRRKLNGAELLIYASAGRGRVPLRLPSVQRMRLVRVMESVDRERTLRRGSGQARRS